MATTATDGGHIWPPREGDARMVALCAGNTTPSPDVIAARLIALGYTGSLDDMWHKYIVATGQSDTSEPFTLTTA